MPFSETTKKHTKEYWTDHFNNFLKPLIEGIPNLEAHRSEPLRGDILRQIITDLVVSPIVIADLTDKNVNVLWELGVRQSFRHGTITIAEEGTKLPFDVFAKATLEYKYNTKNSLQIAPFKEQFKKAIQDCLLNPKSPDSHVLETLSGRGTLFEILQRDELIRRLNAVLSECDSNLIILDSLINVYGKNKNRGWLDIFKQRRWFSAARFSTIAIELLVTHRYLDENNKFYGFAESYMRYLVAMNGQLDNYDSDAANDFILNRPELSRAIILNLKRNAETALDKLIKLV